MIQLADVQSAAQRLAGQVLDTPCLESRTLSQLVGARVFLKFENLQFTASFKERGALNKLLALVAERDAGRAGLRGVIAASAGNHAQGVAHHAQRLGLRAVIVMPRQRGRPHLLGGFERRVKLFGRGVKVQNALCALVVLQAGGGTQLLQHGAAVGAQTHNLLDVVPCACRGAFAHELHAPQPLPHVCPNAKQQRRVFFAQPLQDLEWRTGVGPGLGMADRDLPAVGEAGFRRGRGLAVYHGDFVAELRKVISRADAEQAAPKDDDVHRGSICG